MYETKEYTPFLGKKDLHHKIDDILDMVISISIP